MPNPYTVGNAPEGGSYTPPSVDFSWLGNLPDDYYKGRVMRRQDALATAFQHPEDYKNPDGSYDFNKMTDKVLSIGGLEAGGPMLNQMMKFGLAKQFGIGETQPNVGEAPATQSGYPQRGDSVHTGPGHLRPQQTFDSEQPETIRSLATGISGGQDASGLIRMMVTKLRKHPDAPLTPQEEQEARSVTGGGGPLAGPPGPSVAGMAPGLGVPPQQGGQPAAQPGPASAGVQSLPSGPNSAIGAQPGPGPAPSGPYAQGGPAQGERSEVGIPPEFSRMARGMVEKALNASVARDQATAIMFPESAKQDNPRTAALRDRLKQIDEFRSKWFTRTPEQQNAASAGFGNDIPGYEALTAGVKKGKELQATEGHKMTDNILAGGRAYDTDMKPLFTVAKGIVNDPAFYSGFGGNLDLLKNRLVAALGWNPNAPQTQEMLQKITAMGTLATINQQKYDVSAAGDNAGRIFAQQVDLVSKTVPGLENSIAGNAALVEINDRLGQFRSKMAELARQELAAQRAGKRGRELQLDPRLTPDLFDGRVEAYLKEHPIFTPEEARNPQLIGAPTFKSRAEAEARLPAGKHLPYKGPNWKPGDQYYVRP